MLRERIGDFPLGTLRDRLVWRTLVLSPLPLYASSRSTHEPTSSPPYVSGERGLRCGGEGGGEGGIGEIAASAGSSSWGPSPRTLLTRQSFSMKLMGSDDSCS